VSTAFAPRPVIGPPAPAKWPEWETSRLANGLRIMLADLPGRRMMAARLIVGCGAAQEDPARSGIMRLLMQAMATATIRRDPDALAGELARNGATVTADSDRDAAYLGITAPVGMFSSVIPLLAEIVAEPALASADIERLKSKRLIEIAGEDAQPQPRAENAFLAVAYSPGCGYGRPAGGTAQTVAHVDTPAIREQYGRSVGPANATLLLAGDLAASGVGRQIEEALGRWQAPAPEARRVAARPAAGGRRVVMTDLRGGNQTTLLYGRAVPLITAAEIAPLEALVHAIGGWFGSRLNMLLREEKGYTYGCSAQLISRAIQGGCQAEMQISAPVESSSTGPAAEAIISEVDRLASGGLGAEDLRISVNNLIRSQPMRMLTAKYVVGMHARLLQRGHDLGFIARLCSDLASVDVTAVRSVAERYFRQDDLALIAVGDSRVIEPALSEVRAVPAVVA
jgi:predicted Zn-dependent peptidase